MAQFPERREWEGEWMLSTACVVTSGCCKIIPTLTDLCNPRRRYPGPKPDILYRLERGEEPWVCTPRSPVRWDGPNSPSPGHGGDVSCPEEPPSGWWPGAGGCRGLEERTRAPCQVREQQNKKTDPRESLHGDPGERFRDSPRQGQRPSGEETFLQGNGELSAEELNETILKDHCYYAMSAMQLWHCAPHLCPLREHDYCRDHEAGVSALKDHEYCQVQRVHYQDRVNKVVPLTRRTPSMLHRLANQKSQIGRIISRSKRIMWRCKRVGKRLAFPRGPSGACGLSKPTVPLAKAEENPAKRTCGAFCPSAKQETALPPPRSRGTSHRVTSEARCTPGVSFEPMAAPPPSNPATEGKREAAHPKACVHCEAQRARPIWSPDTKQNTKGHQLVNSKYVSLHSAYKMVMRTVDHVLDSVCQNFELGGYSQRKNIWPTIIRIDR
nr:PREDICTED: uncharacterized protein LOC104333611 [Opisthocomus hoazin]